MNQEIQSRWISLLIFTLTWYVFMIFTAGTFIPGGLFVPAMIIGCAIGALIKDLRSFLLASDNPVIGQSYEIMGCAAMLAGFTR
jgi:H+/Cl- antiporter ClcA